MAKILLTGGSGYLGSKLTRLLKDNGHAVCLVLRPQSNEAPVSDILEPCDIKRFSSYQELQETIVNVRPDVFVHLACCYGRNAESDSDMIQANLMLGVTMLEASTKLGYPIHFINTDTCLQRNLNSYSLSKAQFADWGKLLANRVDSNLTFINVRLQQFYGPADDRSKLPSHIVHSCFKNVKDLKLTTGSQLRDFIYIDDVLSAYLTLIDNVESFKSFIEVQLGTGKSIPVKEFVETVHKLTSSSTNLLFGAIPTRKDEPKECVADIKLMSTLGWSPKFSLVEGLKEMIRYELNMVKK
tara:strand:- start:10175 stop:11068 length:894 start_codon:yes stop_codon:yes gene_type:complete